jgi:hypothetical protein
MALCDSGRNHGDQLSQLSGLRARAGDGFHVRIEAVVAGRLPKENRLCLVDVTGCIEVSGIAGTETLGTGQKILITGVSGWTDNQVGIRGGFARALGPEIAAYPEHISLEQPLLQSEDLKWVDVAGEIQDRHATGNELSFEIQDGLSSVRVHLWCEGNPDQLPLPGTKVSVRGICLGAFNERGQRVAANLWGAGWDSLSVPGSQNNSQLRTRFLTQKTQPEINSTILTTIEQIRRLTQEQIRNRPRVMVRGVVTDQLEGFIQDDTAGIEVAFPAEEKRKITELGAYIEVAGWAGLDEVGSPVISADHVEVLGRGKLPQPQRLSVTQLMSGQIDAQWIEVEGVVRSTDGSHLLIICDGRELMATIAVATDGVVEGLVDAMVRVRGVGITAMDDQDRVQGIHLLIPSIEQVDVIEPPRDPKMLPVRKIGSLLGLNGPRESFHRVKVEGVVTLQENQKVFLQDDTGSAMAILKEDVVLDARFGHSRWLYWQMPQTKAASNSDLIFRPGERVQVVGFPETHRYSPVLTEVTVIRLGTR